MVVSLVKINENRYPKRRAQLSL